MNLATYIMNFKKIGSKLWPWQCPRGRIQNGCRDVINYANESKLKRTPLDLWRTILWKLSWNRLSSFAILARTHTHRQTHRQTPPRFPDPYDHKTFSQWKWLNVKNTHNSIIFPISTSWKSDLNFGYKSPVWKLTNMAAMTSSNMLLTRNANKNNNTSMGSICLTLVEISRVVLANGCWLADRHTHTYTHTLTHKQRQTTQRFSGPKQPQYIQ